MDDSPAQAMHSTTPRGLLSSGGSLLQRLVYLNILGSSKTTSKAHGTRTTLHCVCVRVH
eukprot:m.321544 g.321544  ORF g.321544 m.321544 type:complete len:59 (-) comp20336_c0_seq12:1185-1361(-)